MKKLFSIMLIVALVFCFACGAAAETATSLATHARVASRGDGINNVVAIADASSAKTAEVDGHGSQIVKEFTKEIAIVHGSGVAVDEACRVYSIILNGDPDSSNGDYINVYNDDVEAVALAQVLEVSIATADDTNQIILPGGVAFSDGVYIEAIDGDVHTMVIYSEY